jgi:hypothetical protein
MRLFYEYLMIIYDTAGTVSGASGKQDRHTLCFRGSYILVGKTKDISLKTTIISGNGAVRKKQCLLSNSRVARKFLFGGSDFNIEP